MSLVREQATFLVHVRELLQKAGELGFVVTAGELYRTPEQQALHVQNGRSKTMSSQHLKRLAIDLNFFRERPDGALDLVHDADTLRPLGDYWEGLDAANRWGGNWHSFKDTPHFERRDGAAAQALAAAGLADAPERPAAVAPAPGRGMGLLGATVGPHCANTRDDTETVQRLLNLNRDQGRFPLDTPLKPDGIFGQKTADAIAAFQRQAQAAVEPDTQVAPRGACVQALCAALPAGIGDALLSLLYLRAAPEAIATLGPGIRETLAKRAIDTPLRQAHFLAQIGHESGELRFREELASGAAYEGRADLGNAQPGDGPKYKGRGLIQLTGRANYGAYGQALGQEKDLLKKPERVAEDAALCVDAAGWFWERRKLNELADRDDLIGITRRINGGTNGLDDRKRLLQRAKSLLGIA